MTALVCTGRGGRGCPCEAHAVAKVRAREWARRRRQRRLEEANRSQRTCQKRRSSGRCGGTLDVRVVDGRTVVTCEICERQRRGICRDCPRPVEGQTGKALRCATCKAIAAAARVRASEQRHHDERLVKAREYYQLNAERRERRNEYKRAYRKAHPDVVREYKRRYVMKHGSDERSRYLDYHRRYNAQQARQEKKRAAAVAKYYELHPTRPVPKCTVCGVLVDWTPGHGRPRQTCDEHCSPAERKRREKVAAAIAARSALVEPTTVKPPRAIRIKHPQPVEYAESGERLCVGADCDVVLTGRKKKCRRCREKEQREAQAILEAHRGRGRRTDLGAPEPKRQPVRAKIAAASFVAPVAVQRRTVGDSRPVDATPWSAWLDEGLTTWQMAERLGVIESTVQSRLRLVGVDLHGRAVRNNAKAERSKRNVAAASVWAKRPTQPIEVPA